MSVDNALHMARLKMEICELSLEGVERRLDDASRILRRIECLLAGEPIPHELKEVIFDETAPNGRLI